MLWRSGARWRSDQGTRHSALEIGAPEENPAVRGQDLSSVGRPKNRWRNDHKNSYSQNIFFNRNVLFSVFWCRMSLVVVNKLCICVCMTWPGCLDSGELMMSLFWYYRPEHTQGGRDPSMHCEVSHCCQLDTCARVMFTLTWFLEMYLNRLSSRTRSSPLDIRMRTAWPASRTDATSCR